MRRIVFAILCGCVLVSLGVLTSPVKAGDYYEDGYSRHRHSSNVWYSDNCCYRKIVRHERSVRYEREDDEPVYERRGYYDRPYRSSRYYDAPRRYVNDSYVARRYVNDGDYGYSGYAGYASYADTCSRRKVPLDDGRGGWVWGLKTNCY
jgi:hypothetical protein